jgi:hypothetical protein
MQYIFIVKKLVLIDVSALEAARYDVIWGILGAENKRKLICNSPNDVITGTLRVKKSIKKNFFTIKIYYISSSNHPLHIPKIIFGVSRTLTL